MNHSFHPNACSLSFLLFVSILSASCTPKNRAPSLTAADLAASAKAYDWHTSEQNLRQIGQAIQLYREECGFKPLRERKTFSDAGLPPSITSLATNRGKRWSLPVSTLFVSGQQYDGKTEIVPGTRLGTTYTVVYRSKEADSYWTLRDGELPIIIDTNMYSSRNLYSAQVPIEVLVLRLSGTVERIKFHQSNYKDLLLRR